MRNHSALALAGLCLAAGLVAGPQARAADPSGTAVAVVQSSEAIGPAGRRTLVPAGPVFMGDTIRTSAGGEAQIQLADKTRLVVGPNSSLVVDAFVYSGNGTAKKIAINAVRGAFRFITGNSRKSAYDITTPTATIGVRGTQFDFSVDARGRLSFALFEGQARICSQGRCTMLSGACSVAVVPNGGGVTRLPAGNERTRLLTTAFPFIASQKGLRRAFRVDASSCGTRRADILPRGRAQRTLAGRFMRGADATPPVDTPPDEDPGTPTVNHSHNGFADGTNPGQGGIHNNAPSGGSNNPGGSGNGVGNGNGHGKGRDG